MHLHVIKGALTMTEKDWDELLGYGWHGRNQELLGLLREAGDEGINIQYNDALSLGNEIRDTTQRAFVLASVGGTRVYRVERMPS